MMFTYVTRTRVSATFKCMFEMDKSNIKKKYHIFEGIIFLYDIQICIEDINILAKVKSLLLAFDSFFS